MIDLLGYNEKDFPVNELPCDDAILGRVIEEHRERYFVMTENGVFEAGVTGKIMYSFESKDSYPAVGDWVLLSPLDEDQGIIHQILARKTLLRRRAKNKKDGEQVIAANIDTAFIVMAGNEDFSINRLERYLTIVYNGGIEPVIILNKTDLFSEEEIKSLIQEIKDRHPDVKLVWTSALTKEGIEHIVEHLLPGKTYGFIGSSGVGKSSLINRLTGGERQKVAHISNSSDKGRHTTTYRELIELENGALLIDTPGMREIGISANELGLEETFSDIFDLALDCRFSDCTHRKEPGCAVIAAVERGELQQAKLDNFHQLKLESDYYQMNDYEKRIRDKSFSKMMKEIKRNKKTTS
ncbi:MAG: ribosome small subunit-dependent GTPase A [Candidatus Neomarinimicrobiota bacterium]